MFISEATPNPATLKFLPGRPVLERHFEARDATEAEASPLAKALLSCPASAACSSPPTSFR